MTRMRLQFNADLNNAVDCHMTEVMVDGSPWIEFVDNFDWQDDFNTGMDDDDIDELDHLRVIEAFIDTQAGYVDETYKPGDKSAFDDATVLKNLIALATTTETVSIEDGIHVSHNLIECPGRWRIVIEG